MRKRSWKRLAGCIAIRTALAAVPEYHAGVASAGQVRAVVIEDRHGNRALFAQAAAPIDRPTADFVAVRFVRALQIDRAAILLAGGSGEDLVAALETALAGLEPAAVAYDGRTISITANGQCRATLFPISFDGCTPGTSCPRPYPLRLPDGRPCPVPPAPRRDIARVPRAGHRLGQPGYDSRRGWQRL